ncbi:MAG: glycogen synthase GlgA [Nitrospiria bacterium]
MGGPLKILFAASEVTPFSKTGGLADVAAALPRALAGLGHDVRLVTPRYREFAGPVEPLTEFPVDTPGGTGTARVGRATLPKSAVPVYTIEDDLGRFDREGFYQAQGRDFDDNLDRFAFFSRAAVELPGRLGWSPDILHCHDWQTGLIPLYLARSGPARGRLRTVLTVHNLGYQGVFPSEQFPVTGLEWDAFTLDGLEFYGRINLLKGGLLAADVVTTVSPTYAREIQTSVHGHGLDGVLAARRADLVGILNGIDTAEWDPAADPALAAPFSAADPAGKAACRDDLARRVGLPAAGGPILALVTRLVEQKGIDVLVDVMPELALLDVRVVVLGTGDAAYEAALRNWTAKAPKHIAAVLGFDDALAHRIMAGADLFLMPSRYEPCGLSQLYAMRYGAVPVCHRTGGLADTVVDYAPSAAHDGRATGFLFEPCSPDSFRHAIQLALAVYRDPPAWRRLMSAGMRSDFGWERSAAEYVAVYERALARPPRGAATR